MTPDQNLLKKIRALATMADPTRGGSKAEVEYAAKQMQKLMDRYNISLLEVMNEAESTPEKFVQDKGKIILGAVKQWHWGLGATIGRIMSTKHYASTRKGVTARGIVTNTTTEHWGNVMCFFGAPQAVQASIELFDLWVIDLDKLAVDATSEYVKAMQNDAGWQELMAEQGVKQFRHLQGLGSAHPTVWRMSWLSGLIQGINIALNENENERKQETILVSGSKHPHGYIGATEAGSMTVTGAMVLFNQKLDEQYRGYQKLVGMRTVSSSSSRLNWNAHDKGVAVGKQIKLNSKRLG